jgi:hypothetical protein
MYIIFSDIISIENTDGPTSRNVFALFNRYYKKQAHLRKDSFISTTKLRRIKDLSSKFAVTFVLLPHQILILPKEYLSKIDEKDYQLLWVIDDQELR